MASPLGTGLLHHGNRCWVSGWQLMSSNSFRLGTSLRVLVTRHLTPDRSIRLMAFDKVNDGRHFRVPVCILDLIFWQSDFMFHGFWWSEVGYWGRITRDGLTVELRSNADISESQFWYQWESVLILVRGSVAINEGQCWYQWGPRLISVRAKADISESQCWYQWESVLILVRANVAINKGQGWYQWEPIRQFWY